MADERYGKVACRRALRCHDASEPARAGDERRRICWCVDTPVSGDPRWRFL